MRKVARELNEQFGYLPANQLTKQHVEKLRQAWKGRINGWSQRSYTSQLRKILRHIAATTGNAEIEVRLPREGPQRTRIATPEERVAIWRVASTALRYCLLCWTELGLRFAEALRIRPEDIDEEKRIVTVLVKGGKTITLPVPQELAKFLAALGPFQEGVPLITQILGTNHNPENVMRSQWEEARKKAGVANDLHIHDLRRTLATTLYRATLDPMLVQQALGHSNLRATASYLAPHEPEKLRAMLESIQWRWKQ